MIRLSSKGKDVFKQHANLVAQRSEIIQQCQVAKADADLAASQLEAQRSASETGAAASERFRRATVKFDEAESHCGKLARSLNELNSQIVQLEPALQAEANNGVVPKTET